MHMKERKHTRGDENTVLYTGTIGVQTEKRVHTYCIWRGYLHREIRSRYINSGSVDTQDTLVQTLRTRTTDSSEY